jgi:two-component system NarL family sensor kinase
MRDGPIEASADQPRIDVARLNRRVVLAFLIVALVACVVAAALLLVNAYAERQSNRERAFHTASALSFGFDQEVAAVNYLLKGLSTSPALLSGELQAFHTQMRATPIPEGSWLILQDLRGQVLNTLRPYGERLPSGADMPHYDDLVARLQVRPWTVSGRLKSPMTGGYVVGLSLRIEPPGRELKTWLTAILAEPRLNSLLDAQAVATGWKKVLYDRELNPIVSSATAIDAPANRAPQALRLALTKAAAGRSAEGLIEGVDDLGAPVLVAYRRSDATDWITTVSAPTALVNAPFTELAWRLVGPGLLLLAAGATAALFTARQMQTPLSSLISMVASARGEVAELSGQLLALQEEERRRIARELHDSTVQHLVATILGLARLDAELGRDPAKASLTRKEIAGEVQLALNELRVFTYLLHPPELATEGLASTLQEFAAGFGRRSGLQMNVQVLDALDEVPPSSQLALLRVAQEALANIHRHAMASRVDISCRVFRGRLFVRIGDNGRGMGAVTDEPTAMGVGVPGMRARLRQINGDLRVASGTWGTAILACVPFKRPG